MDCVGIVAEFNPFHKGHEYMLKKVKPDHIMAVMSGNFVQRGDVAIFDKFARVKSALMSGADIVIELPVIYASANAERFAKAAIYLMHASGIVNKLAFGTETDDIAFLGRTADKIANISIDNNKHFKHALKAGMSYPRAISQALQTAYELTPNNILAIEYLKALKSFDSPIEPLAVKRINADHDAASPVEGDYQSASYIRKLILSDNLKACERYLPYDINSLNNAELHSLERVSDAIIYSLRMRSTDELKQLPDVTEGFENVIYKACRECVNIQELMTKIKTKRYTMARIRRILIYSLLDITKELYSSYPLPLYIRVLGIKKEALFLLSELSRKASLPIIKDFSDVRSLDAQARAQLDFEMRSDCIYNMASYIQKPVVNDFSMPLLIV